MFDLKTPPGVEHWEHGEPKLVLRPRDQAMTLTLAKIAYEHQNKEALKQAISGGPCEFLGFLAHRDGKIVAIDENGENPVPIEAGDILAAPSDLWKPD